MHSGMHLNYCQITILLVFYFIIRLPYDDLPPLLQPAIFLKWFGCWATTNKCMYKSHTFVCMYISVYACGCVCIGVQLSPVAYSTW